MGQRYSHAIPRNIDIFLYIVNMNESLKEADKKKSCFKCIQYNKAKYLDQTQIIMWGKCVVKSFILACSCTSPERACTYSFSCYYFYSEETNEVIHKVYYILDEIFLKIFPCFREMIFLSCRKVFEVDPDLSFRKAVLYLYCIRFATSAK